MEEPIPVEDQTDYSEYNFIIRSVQAGVIRILFESLKDVLNEIVLSVDESGITLCQMNYSKTLLVHIKLIPKSFELFKCNTKSQLGLNLTTFFLFLKLAENTDTVTLFQRKNNDGNLEIKLENSDKNKTIVSAIKLLAIDFNALQVPSMTFDAIIHMPTSDFQTTCKKLSGISETLIIESIDNQIRFTADGDSGSVTMDIGESSTGVELQETTPHARGEFNFKHLLSLSKSANLCTTVAIYLQDGNPLVLVFNVANLGQIKYLICPKETV
jgi:proliferating cell nuclear antigen